MLFRARVIFAMSVFIFISYLPIFDENELYVDVVQMPKNLLRMLGLSDCLLISYFFQPVFLVCGDLTSYAAQQIVTPSFTDIDT